MKIENPNPIQWQFSERAQQLQSSFIREILKITQRPEIISFAGGLPSPATFPVDVMKAAYDKVLSETGKVALQYGPTDGYGPLREWIANSLSTEGSRILPEQILMTSGSQQALDLLGKVLIDEGSRVLVETPSYLGALQAFSVYRPEFKSVDTDEHGLVPSSIEGVAQGARLLYSLPNFQNPTGRTLSIERRQELVETCARLGVPLIEDDPYGALSYKGEPMPKMVAMNPDGVIYMGSFSKVLTPGIRLGYVCAPLPLVRRLELAKQAADLHTAQLTQMVVHEVVKDGFLDQHIPTIRKLYGAGRARPGQRELDPPGRRHVHLGDPAEEHRCDETARPVAGGPRGLRAGCAVLRQRAGHQYPAPVLRDRAAGTHPRRHRHPWQADQGHVVITTRATASN
jgi:2-aminoadipate transaminase